METIKDMRQSIANTKEHLKALKESKMNEKNIYTEKDAAYTELSENVSVSMLKDKISLSITCETDDEEFPYVTDYYELSPEAQEKLLFFLLKFGTSEKDEVGEI